MHASFMGVYVCQIVYFKYVIYHKAVTSNVVLKIVPIQKPNMFTMALFTKDKTRCSPNSLAGERIRQNVIHTREYYSAMKKTEVLIHATDIYGNVDEPQKHYAN